VLRRSVELTTQSRHWPPLSFVLRTTRSIVAMIRPSACARRHDDTISCLRCALRDTPGLRPARRQQFRITGYSAWRRLQCHSSGKRDGRLWSQRRTGNRNLQVCVPGLLGLAAKADQGFERRQTKIEGESRHGRNDGLVAMSASGAKRTLS